MRKSIRTPVDRTGPKEVLWFIALWLIGVTIVVVIGLVIKYIGAVVD